MTPPMPPAPLAANSMVQIGAGGLPVIQCRPNAPASRMSAKKLLQLEQAAQTAEDQKRAGIVI